MTSNFTRSWQVGRYTATLNVPQSRQGAHAAVIEWEPRVPPYLTDEEAAQYRAGRDEALAELVSSWGG